LNIVTMVLFVIASITQSRQQNIHDATMSVAKRKA